MPVRFVSFADGTVLNAIFDSSTRPPVPDVSITPFVNEKPLTWLPPLAAATPFTPLPAVFSIFMKANEGLVVWVSAIPAPVVFWMVPPVQVAAVESQVPALPVTVRPAVAPVLFRIMPLAAPLAEMLWNLSPFAPMEVLATFSAVAVVVVSAFTTAEPEPQGFLSQTSTVPPPVASKAELAPVLTFMPPWNRIVAPVLLERLTPVQLTVQLRAPFTAVVPPVRLDTFTISPALLLVTLTAIVTLPLLPDTLTPVPVPVPPIEPGVL